MPASDALTLLVVYRASLTADGVAASCRAIAHGDWLCVCGSAHKICAATLIAS